MLTLNLLAKVPVPDVVQDALVAGESNDPEIEMEGVNEQTFWSNPAKTVGKLLKVMFIESFAAGHAPLGSLVVKVNLVFPLAMSSAFGVKMALGLEDTNEGSNEEVQFPEFAAPDKLGFKFAEPFSQIV